MSRAYQVHEFAEMAGVTVRTLHHYDRLDLLNYPWLEEDSIAIRLPEGLTPEDAASPAPLVGKLGKYEVQYRQEDGSLVFNRFLRLGDNASILFPASDYPQVKKIFDWVYKSDNHTLSLR